MSQLDPQISSFFQDPDASTVTVVAAQQVLAPIVRGAPITPAEAGTGGGLRVVYLLLDGSQSMDKVAEALRQGFNHDFVPALKEAREDDVSALRLGGAAFSSGSPWPIWRGPGGNYFHPLDQLPQLTTVEYDPENRGGSTSLHLALLEGTPVALRYAADLQAQTGIDVDLDIIVLSDGANTDRPLDPSPVRQMIRNRDRTRMRFLFFYFQTMLGRDDIDTYATRDLGFDGEQVQSFLRPANETPDQQRKRFRRMLNVISRVSASKGVSAVAATAAVMDDPELI